jgi:hypothetical protein
VVWAKTNAGVGSLYRSQHDLLPLFKKGSASHVNNLPVGKRGRHRTNVWTYREAPSLGPRARKGLSYHRSEKPIAMVEGALIADSARCRPPFRNDLAHRSDLISPTIPR